MRPALGARTFSVEDNRNFTSISGEYNPLHVVMLSLHCGFEAPTTLVPQVDQSRIHLRATAGDALCEQPRRLDPLLSVVAPRLPRLLGDQTSTVKPCDYPDTISV